MVSAMQSREFGWGMQLTEDQLKQVNAKRLKDKDYFDTIAAKDVFGTSMKKRLTESPFIRRMEHGANKDGYWTGNHMIVQFEDCLDCLKVLFQDKYDFFFLFDHSSGHVKMRINGLDASKMTKGYGGSVQHSTMIKKTEGFIGEFHHSSNYKMVTVGKEQLMNWEGGISDDDGPWYLSVKERQQQRNNQWISLPESKWKAMAKSRRNLLRRLARLIQTTFST